MSELKEAGSLPGSESSSEEYWQSHLEGWQASGLKQIEYCRLHGLSYPMFRNWKSQRCKSASPEEPLKLVEAKVSGIQSLSFPMQPGGSKGHPGVMRLWVDEFCIDIGADFSPDVLKKLIHTLQEVR